MKLRNCNLFPTSQIKYVTLKKKILDSFSCFGGSWKRRAGVHQHEVYKCHRQLFKKIMQMRNSQFEPLLSDASNGCWAGKPIDFPWSDSPPISVILKPPSQLSCLFLFTRWSCFLPVYNWRPFSHTGNPGPSPAVFSHQLINHPAWAVTRDLPITPVSPSTTLV